MAHSVDLELESKTIRDLAFRLAEIKKSVKSISEKSVKMEPPVINAPEQRYTITLVSVLYPITLIGGFLLFFYFKSKFDILWAHLTIWRARRYVKKKSVK
jgi:hypothetical protein